MKALLGSFLIITLASAGALAQCGYFRLSADLLKCETADAKTLDAANPYPAAVDLPEFQDQAAQSLVQVSCSCEYSLSGSDPRCDMEETLEKSSIIGADNPTVTCRRGKSLCKDVCPARLP